MSLFERIKEELENIVKTSPEDFITAHGYKNLKRMSRTKTCAISKLTLDGGRIKRMDLFPVKQAEKILNSLVNRGPVEVGQVIEPSKDWKDPRIARYEELSKEISDIRMKQAFENVVDCLSTKRDHDHWVYRLVSFPTGQRKFEFRSSGYCLLDNSNKLRCLKELAKQHNYL